MMNKSKKILLLLPLIIISCVILPLTSFCKSIKASMSGPEILRVDSTLKITYTVENAHCYGFQGNITYNSQIMTLVSAKALQNNWVIELLGEGKFIAYSKNPLDEETEFKGGDIFTLEFSISKDANVGDLATLDFTNVIATDTQEEIIVPNSSYIKSIDPPASSDATISTLFITNASYSPAFSPEITEYTIPMGVGYDVTSLEINAVPSDQKATCTIDGNQLRVGNNTVTITVTAEDGTVKKYTITLRRAHEPTEHPSNNTNLSELIISSGSLSPEFSPEIREYIVYLPNEIKSFSANGKAEDEFAHEVINVDTKLNTGVNDVTVKCYAEDGSLGEYLIHVVVMPEYVGFVPTINNSIPLVGTVDISGEFKIGSVLTASIEDGYQGSEYTVEWYRNSQLVKKGADYTLTDEDKESVISVIVKGSGFFSGSLQSQSFTVLKTGEIVQSSTYIPSPPSSNITAFAIIIVIASALALSIGVIIGMKRAKKEA